MLAAAVVGGMRPSQVITWTDENGVPLDLTGATITARIANNSTGVVVDSDGVFTIVNAPEGRFRWDYSEDDITVAGYFDVQFSAEFDAGPTPARTIRLPWQVRSAI